LQLINLSLGYSAFFSRSTGSGSTPDRPPTRQ